MRPLAGTVAILAALSTLGLSAPAQAVLAPGDSVRTLAHDGVERSYRLHVPPSYDGSTPVPLVLNFHGLGSNAAQQEFISSIVPVSDRAGFIVAHPEGLNNSFNGGICCSGENGPDDVGFARAIVAAIAAEGAVNPRRIYVTGLSNGGAMTQRLACDAADLFAAASPMAFPLPYTDFTGCRPSRAIPVLTVMGLTDVLVTYENGPFATAPATFAYWREIDGCTGDAPDRTETVGQSRCETYTSCADGAQVGLCSVTANAFGGTTFDGHILYLNPDFNLAEVAWAFLSQFELPEDPGPGPATLAGNAVLRVGRRHSKEAIDWTLQLGGGTWTVTTADGTAYTGSARPLGKRGRRWALAFTSDARDAFETGLGARIQTLLAGGPVVTPAPGEWLHVRTDKNGTPVAATGTLRLLRDGQPGASVGRYALRVRRTRS